MLLSSVDPGFPGGTSGEEPACQCREKRDAGLILGQEDLLEKGMATHSSILAGEYMDRGAWQASVHGMAKSQTQLKRLIMDIRNIEYLYNTCETVNQKNHFGNLYGSIYSVDNVSIL